MDAVVGLRVVRGPDWDFVDEESDGGEGFTGTVVEVGGWSPRLREKLVSVQWDMGIRQEYRVGNDGAYKLLVIDSAPAGKKLCIVKVHHHCSSLFKLLDRLICAGLGCTLAYVHR